MPVSVSEEDLLRVLAAQHLPGAQVLTLDLGDDESGHVNPVSLVRAAESQRLLGPLQEAVESGRLLIPAAAREYLAARQAATMLWCLQIEVRLLELCEWFAEAGGVEFRVIKGPAVAHLDELDPALRSFADLDLLVAADDLDRAVAVLEAHGATRPWPQRRPAFDRRFAKSVTMTCQDSVEVDLHRTLCDGAYGVRLPLAELFRDVESFELGGEQIRALSAPHRMLHAAYHAVLGSRTPRLSSLRDIAGYLTTPELGPEFIVPTAERWRGVEVLAVAVEETFDALHFSAPVWTDWLADAELDRQQLEVIERHRREGSSFGRAKLDLWHELPGAAAKLAYGRAVIWPTSAHLRERGLRRADPVKSLLGRWRSPQRG